MLEERKNAMIAMRERLQEEFREQKSQLGLNSDLCKHIFSLLNARINTLGVRSYFVYTIFQYVREQAGKEGYLLNTSWEKIWFETKLPFVAEVIIAVQYYENVILDGKGGVLKRTPQNMEGEYDRKKLQDRLIGSHYIKDLLYDYIDDCIFDKDDYARISMTQKAVRRIFKYVDLGQVVQAEYGTFSDFSTNYKHVAKITPQIDSFLQEHIIDYWWRAIEERDIPDQHEIFAKNYLRRIYLTSGALYGILAELIMDLLGYQGKERSNIVHFALNFGILGQVVNDTNDFTPPEAELFTVSKIPADAFSDLMNDNITLPLIFYFSENEDSYALKNLQRLCAFPKRFVREVYPSLCKAQSVARIMGRYIKLFLCTENTFSEMLWDMVSISHVEDNRFYRAIRASALPVKQIDTSDAQRQTSPHGNHVSEYCTEKTAGASRTYKEAGNARELPLCSIGFQNAGTSKNYIRRDKKFSMSPVCC